MTGFSENFVDELDQLFVWRRDVRSFRTAAPPEALITAGLEAMRLAPSVGLSEPWRVIRVESADARAACVANFEAANADALAGYDGDQARGYAALKLSGMREAPVQLAVFCDDATSKGAGLGARTMPETRVYSVVGAISYLWLALRARGVGLGWVSILDPVRLARDLDAPDDWRLVAYLCIGWPAEESDAPELERAGWSTRAETFPVIAR